MIRAVNLKTGETNNENPARESIGTRVGRPVDCDCEVFVLWHRNWPLVRSHLSCAVNTVSYRPASHPIQVKLGQRHGVCFGGIQIDCRVLRVVERAIMSTLPTHVGLRASLVPSRLSLCSLANGINAKRPSPVLA